MVQELLLLPPGVFFLVKGIWNQRLSLAHARFSTNAPRISPHPNRIRKVCKPKVERSKTRYHIRSLDVTFALPLADWCGVAAVSRNSRVRVLGGRVGQVRANDVERIEILSV